MRLTVLVAVFVLVLLMGSTLAAITVDLIPRKDNTYSVSNASNWYVNGSFRGRLLIGDVNHSIMIGSSRLNGIAESAFTFMDDGKEKSGEIAYQFLAGNNTLLWMQVGRNNSFGGWGNSFGLVPNFWGIENYSNSTNSVNMTLLSDYVFLCTNWSKPCLYNADTRGRGGPLFWTAADGEFWRTVNIMEGISVRGFSTFIMDGNDFDIINGSLHPVESRIELVGFDQGDNLSLLGKDFENGQLEPFVQITSGGGASEWTVVSSANCDSGQCARAIGGTGSPQRIMETNFSTDDSDNINMSVNVTTLNIDNGDIFNITINNNDGSGELEFYGFSNGTNIVNDKIQRDFPASMDNKTKISLRFYFQANNPINEEAYVDFISVIGTATATTSRNVTRLDTTILLGDGTRKIFWNGTSNILELPANTTFTTVNIQEINTTNITLNGSTITDWSQVNTTIEEGDDIDVSTVGTTLTINIEEVTNFIRGMYGVSNRDLNFTLTSGGEGNSIFGFYDRNDASMLQIRDLDITFNKDLMPATDEDFSMGNSTNRMSEIHLSDLYPSSIISYYGSPCGSGGTGLFTYDIGDDGTFACAVPVGKGNTTEQMQDAVGAGINESLLYDDAANILHVNNSDISITGTQVQGLNNTHYTQDLANKTFPKNDSHAAFGFVNMDGNIEMNSNTLTGLVAKACVANQFFNSRGEDMILSCGTPTVAEGDFNVTGDLFFNHSHTLPVRTNNTNYQAGDRTLMIYGSVSVETTDPSPGQQGFFIVYTDSSTPATRQVQRGGIILFENIVVATINDAINTSFPFSFVVQPFDYYRMDFTEVCGGCDLGLHPKVRLEFWNEVEL